MPISSRSLLVMAMKLGRPSCRFTIARLSSEQLYLVVITRVLLDSEEERKGELER